MVEILIGNMIDGRRACSMQYTARDNSLLLLNDSGSGGAGRMVLDGMARAIENSQCRIDGAGSSASGSEKALKVTVNVTFKQAFAGYHVIYLSAPNATDKESYWQALGVWQAPGGTARRLASASVVPARGSGESGDV